MKTILILIEVLSGISLIVCVLMLSPKGEGLGGIGGQARLFNTQRDLESNLQRITTFFAIIFFIAAGILGVFY